ncbi:hypothetical protein C8034_v002317 [Colletotrichum sidae]|uniref:Uncharacterized protein n=1 Tax=Colletotrichum sidae TaxID=1347389 RepID=A0A4R8TDA6_9PEZI|nr:hypothetical protein C8034_v002317 [Colletotrichum sidae]
MWGFLSERPTVASTRSRHSERDSVGKGINDNIVVESGVDWQVPGDEKYASTVRSNFPRGSPPSSGCEHVTDPDDDGVSRILLYTASAQTPEPVRKLICEFRDWTGCQHSFSLDEVDRWIQHIEDDHLRGRYPAASVCWYCDIGFNEKLTPDLDWNFEARLRHIAGHIVEGDRFECRRPDFLMLNHVHGVGLISSETFQQCISLSEGPPAPVPDGLYPRGWRPERAGEGMRIVPEERGRRSRKTGRHYC